jgi:hypothetical protein
MLETAVSDADEDFTSREEAAGDTGEDGASEDTEARRQGMTLVAYQDRAAAVYQCTSSACMAGSTGFRPSSSVPNLLRRFGPMPRPYAPFYSW